VSVGATFEGSRMGGRFLGSSVLGIAGLVAVAALITGGVVSSASAVVAPPTFTWSGADVANSTNWSDGANWVGGTATAARMAISLTATPLTSRAGELALISMPMVGTWFSVSHCS
jgi:hypothetical protein